MRISAESCFSDVKTFPQIVLINTRYCPGNTAKVNFYFHLSALTLNNFKTAGSQFSLTPNTNNIWKEPVLHPGHLAPLATDLTPS